MRIPQALPGGILPIMLNDHYGPRSYVIVGYAQSLKGMLAFIAAPAIGALSDVVGRKHLFLTCVLGTASLVQHATEAWSLGYTRSQPGYIGLQQPVMALLGTALLDRVVVAP